MTHLPKGTGRVDLPLLTPLESQLESHLSDPARSTFSDLSDSDRLLGSIWKSGDFFLLDVLYYTMRLAEWMELKVIWRERLTRHSVFSLTITMLICLPS
jgi:hypothetical protein